MAPGTEWCHAELLALAAVSQRFFGCLLQPCSRFGGGTRGTPLTVRDMLTLDAAARAGGGSEQVFAPRFTRGGSSASRWHQHSITSPCLLPAALPAPGSGREDRTRTPVSAGTPADCFQPGFWLFLREPFIPNKEAQNHPAVKAFPWPYSGEDQRGAGRGRGPSEGSSHRGNSGGEPRLRPEEGAEGPGPGPGPSRAPPGAARSGGGPGRCGAPAAAAPPRSRPRPGAEQDAATSASRSARRGPGGR